MKDFKVRYNIGIITHCTPEWDWNFGPMKDFDLWVILDGEGSLEINGNQHKLQAGSIFLFSPGCAGYASHNPKTPLRVAAIHFDFIAYDLTQDYLFCNMDNVSFVGELMQEAMISAGNKLQEEADFWLSAVLHKILPFKDYRESDYYSAEIDKLCTQIINYPERQYKVPKMATALGLCKDHFSRIFKSYKEISPRDFVIRARIERACSLLQNSNMNASEIADHLDYSSVNFFCRQFKAQTGKTVLQFQRQS